MEDNSFDLQGFLNTPQAQANKPAAMQYLQSKGIIDLQGNPVPGKVKSIQPASPDTRNPLQKVLGTFLDPIVQQGVRAGQALGSAYTTSVNALDRSFKIPETFKNIGDANNQDLKVPFLGTNVPAPSKDTPENVAGKALSTVALGAEGPVAAGALLGMGNAMTDNKDANSVGVNTVVGAIGGKILEHGFNAVAPFVEQAALKYGTPFLDKIASYVPDSAKGFMDNLASKLPDIAGTKVLPGPVSSAIQKTNEGLSTTLDAPVSMASSKVKSLYDSITGQGTPENVDKFIIDTYNSAVRPSVSGKNSSSQVDAQAQKIISAVKKIVDNKANLQLTTNDGETVNKLPSTLKETVQAVDQTQSQIFKQYDTLASASGEAGAKVDLTPIAGELRKVATDPVMVDTHPELATYAETRAKALENRGFYTPEQAQQAIAIYNKSLEAFYKNPSYDNATKASIDSMIVNQMRGALDSTIENSSGAGYQDLKNQYGALKSMEKDVVHRAIVDGRKAPKGLLDFADIGSAAELMRGLVTMNPADFATSAGMKLISSYYKYLNNPNTAIERLFTGVEKASAKSAQSLPSKAIDTGLKAK